MLYFLVTVHESRVVVSEVDEVGMYHCKAYVDGDTWLYKIEKAKFETPLDKGWYERGTTMVFWHAHNSGYNVKFEAVHQKQKRRAKKLHDNQLELL